MKDRKIKFFIVEYKEVVNVVVIGKRTFHVTLSVLLIPIDPQIVII